MAVDADNRSSPGGVGPGGVGQASRVSIIAESGQGSPVETRTFFH